MRCPCSRVLWLGLRGHLGRSRRPQLKKKTKDLTWALAWNMWEPKVGQKERKTAYYCSYCSQVQMPKYLLCYRDQRTALVMNLHINAVQLKQKGKTPGLIHLCVYIYICSVLEGPTWWCETNGCNLHKRVSVGCLFPSEGLQCDTGLQVLFLFSRHDHTSFQVLTHRWTRICTVLCFWQLWVELNSADSDLSRCSLMCILFNLTHQLLQTSTKSRLKLQLMLIFFCSGSKGFFGKRKKGICMF